MPPEDQNSPVSVATPALPSPSAGETSRWHRFRGWCSRKWAANRLGPEARRGAIWGTFFAAAISVVAGGFVLRTGFGYLFDFAFCILFAVILIPLVALLVSLIIKIFQKLPPFSSGLILGAGTIIMFLWGLPQLGVFMAVGVSLSAGFLGATIATLVSGHFGEAVLSK